MIQIVAVLEFSTLDKDKNFTVKIKDVRSDATKADMEALMDYVIANKIFVSETGDLQGKVACRLDTTNTTEMKF